MKNLSFWAKKNPRSARAVIVLAKIFLAVYGLYLGAWLLAKGVRLPSVFLPFAISGYLAAVFLYPIGRRATGFFRYSYWRQKSCDFAIGLCALLVFVGGGNDFARALTAEGQPAAGVHAMAIAIRPSVAMKDWRPGGDSNQQRSWLGRTWQQGKNLFRSFFAKSRSSKIDAGQVILTILLAVAAFFLLGLVAALSCSIACNGFVAGAVIVLLGGTAGVVYLYVIALREIYKKTGEEKEGILLGLAILILGALLLLLTSG